MKNFIKQNWFRIGILLSLFLIGFCFLYYYFSYLPTKDNLKIQAQEEEKFLENMQKCRELGNKIYQEQLKKEPKGTVMNPEFTYNKKLNTCLYAGGTLNYYPESGIHVAHWVIDSLTNKTLTSYWEVGNKKIDGEESFEEYQKKKDILFNQQY